MSFIFFRRPLAMLAAMLLALITAIGAPRAAAAPPPNLMHYQGRLTTNAGAPITNTRTVYFSLWSGGTAAAANSGTEFYRESVSITPDSNGIFEHMIGSGTLINGALAPGSFNTANPVFVQVAVDTVGTVLLPRAQLGSVGYSMLAGYAASSGTPQVTSVVDATGGLTVVGDRIQINGSGLATAGVTIGGIKAPISSQSATQIEVQVPQKVKAGPNAVEVSENIAGGKAVLAHHLDVHRLVAGLSSGGSGALTIFDAKDGAVVLRDTALASVDSNSGPLQMAFANNGSLLLVPTGLSNTVYAYDMTTNPPSRKQALDLGGDVFAVATSPDGTMTMASVQQSSRVRPINMNQTKPPYTATVMGSIAGNLSNLNDNGTFNPRGSTWVGNGLFIVVGNGTNQVRAYRRYPPSNTIYFVGFANPQSNLRNVTSTATAPAGLTLTPDGSRFFVTSFGSAPNVNGFYTSTEGFSAEVSGAAGGATPSAMAISPEGNMGYVVDVAADLMHTYYLNGATAILAGDIEGPSASGTNFQTVAVEPVAGDRAVAGTNNSTYWLYERRGAAMVYLTEITVTSSGRRSLAVEFQP